MSDHKATIDELANLMEEFRLSEASLTDGDFKIAFSKKSPIVVSQASFEGPMPEIAIDEVEEVEAVEMAVVQSGTPITSPMTGIYYASSSPGAPAFVSEGSSVSAGQVVGLIEAMKVYNEIVASASGVVDRIVAKNGDVVQLGDVLMVLK